MEKQITKYLDYRKKIIAFRYVDWLINWDQKIQAPKKSASFRMEQVEVLSEMYFELRRNKDFLNNVKYLIDNIEKIDDTDLRKDIEIINKELRIIRNVPIEEYIDYQVVLAKSTKVWKEARELNDFDHFVPILEKIVDYKIKVTKYLETEDIKGYDVLLDEYEAGTKTIHYDRFFEYLKKELVPFVLEITLGRRPQFNRKLTTREYPIENQKQFSRHLIKAFNYDLERGAIRDTIHSFTSGISTTDIRITSNYEEYNFTKSIFSVMHELGHAIYDQNIDPKYNGTFVFSGTSYGMHEAQARMFENMIGRSYAFWSNHYKSLVEIFPKQLSGISVVEFYKYINQVKRSRIRTESDELTYSLHIMVRYEIEKELINEKLKVKDIPRRWRTLMAKYVGVKPLNDLEGPLQDIHWANGSFGYFPAYALGSAYAAQIYHAMNKEINVESIIENDHIYLINDWLRKNINQYGASKNVSELLLIATEEPFNPKYYIEYLKNKFNRLKEES